MRSIYVILRISFAVVWFVNGFYCKILGMIPRHEFIVAKILGFEYAQQLTLAIGLGEVIMGFWILSGYRAKFNAITQIVLVLLMNILEVILVPELLLWGSMNMLFAILFVILIFINEFIIAKRLQ
ncbi:DoxX-like family protein [Aureitalea sp. L0-47]|uniref:DoxX-like family protein n=1 Tax=Aureitalea sp. L0-47 TaxID=2816962 RepID=UPI00223822D7|nr:DoxX-like family protein [Aureitalea sp. L0-47]MCW5520213.1 DoxX-like family protein [Aureitalea sp. L0-47]